MSNNRVKQEELENEISSGKSSASKNFCPICYCQFQPLIARLKCNHYFCLACFENMIKMSPNKSCPICRSDCIEYFIYHQANGQQPKLLERKWTYLISRVQSQVSSQEQSYLNSQNDTNSQSQSISNSQSESISNSFIYSQSTSSESSQSFNQFNYPQYQIQLDAIIRGINMISANLAILRNNMRNQFNESYEEDEEDQDDEINESNNFQECEICLCSEGDDMIHCLNCESIIGHSYCLSQDILEQSLCQFCRQQD